MRKSGLPPAKKIAPDATHPEKGPMPFMGSASNAMKMSALVPRAGTRTVKNVTAFRIAVFFALPAEVSQIS